MYQRMGYVYSTWQRGWLRSFLCCRRTDLDWLAVHLELVVALQPQPSAQESLALISSSLSYDPLPYMQRRLTTICLP